MKNYLRMNSFALPSIVTLSSVTFTCMLWSSAEGVVLQQLVTDRLPTSAVKEFISSNNKLSLAGLQRLASLGEQSAFRYANGNFRKTAKGVKRVRLLQTYAGYDVFGSTVEAEVDANECLTGQMYGSVVKDIHKVIPNPEACQRKVKQLQNLAIRLEHLSPNNPNIDQRDGRRIIYAGQGINKAKLAYKIEFLYRGEQIVKRPVYFFDACTGLILLSYDRVRSRLQQENAHKMSIQPKDGKHFNNFSSPRMPASDCSISAEGVGGNEKIGQITYNSAPFCLNVQKVLNLCTMEGTYSRVIDNEQTTRGNKQTVSRFACSSGYSDAINGAFGVANDALYYGEMSGLFYEEKYNMRAFSYKPRLVVHYGDRYTNAFWDGTDSFYGDCDDILHPFVDIDTVAHELAHGVIQMNSDLVYTGMAGGINEAYCDITGEATKFFIRNSNDWLISFDVVKRSAGFEALRYFEDPTRDGRSIKHVLAYRRFLDVHYSSGVFNHAFYRMVVTENMDIYDAFKCFLDANLSLWTPFTNFFSGACNVMQAAYDNGFSHRKVRRAFWRVGIPLIFCNYAALSTSVFVGETRESIAVSASRSPIFKVELDGRKANSTLIEVTNDDKRNIKIVVGEDDEASKVVATGVNTVKFNNSYSRVYVKLMSDSPRDVKVIMKTAV